MCQEPVGLSQELTPFFSVTFTVVLAEIQISGKRVLTPFLLKWGLSGSSNKLTVLKNNSHESITLPRLRGLKVNLIINDSYVTA